MFGLSFFLIYKFALAQSPTAPLSDYSCPDYLFSVDLQKGATHEDVYVIQQILNLDKRTKVAEVGPGSPGKETGFFGIATREALKRFQALFIEFIEVANGKFGPKTRTSMNAVCKGPFFAGGSKNVYDTATSTISATPLIIAVAGPSSTDIADSFRAFVTGSEAIKKPSLTSLFLTNATAGDLRQISSTTFSFLVTPNSDTTGNISLQFEADGVTSEKGIKNENASNEWIIFVTGIATSTGDTFDFPFIDLPLAGLGGDCSTVASVDINDYSNPCYGKTPISQPNNPASDSGGGGGGGKQPPDIMSILKGFMDALKGVGGGGGTDGGTEGGKAFGDCSKIPTTQLTGKLGKINGRYDISANFGSGFFQSNDGILPPAPIYGFKLYPNPKMCKQSCQGACLGACCRPEADTTGQVVNGIVSGNKKKFQFQGSAF